MASFDTVPRLPRSTSDLESVDGHLERFIVTARVLLLSDWHLMAPGAALIDRVDIKWPRTDSWRHGQLARTKPSVRPTVAGPGFISRQKDFNEMSDDSVN